MKNLLIREIETGEEFEVSKLLNRVFMDFIASECSQEGISEFLRYARAERLKERLEGGYFILLAVLRNKIVGMIEIRDNWHISSLFVEGRYQGKRIATRLVQAAIKKCLEEDPGLKFVSVNSAPNSIKFYEKLGFTAIDSERFQNGIRYVPMELETVNATSRF